MVITMDEQTTEQVKTNLDEMKKYADQYPENAGWRWISESVDKTLALIDPEEEKVDEGFDAPKEKEKEPESVEEVPVKVSEEEE